MVSSTSIPARSAPGLDNVWCSGLGVFDHSVQMALDETLPNPELDMRVLAELRGLRVAIGQPILRTEARQGAAGSTNQLIGLFYSIYPVS